MIPEIGPWVTPVDLIRKDVHKSNWNYIDCRVLTEIRQSLLVCSLTLANHQLPNLRSLKASKAFHTQYTTMLVLEEASNAVATDKKEEMATAVMANEYEVYIFKKNRS